MKFLNLLFICCVVLAKNENLQEFKTANKKFTLAIYNEIKNKTINNFLFSSFSAEVILSLIQSGCKNKTGEEIRNVLGLSKEQIESVVKFALLEFKDYNLYTANKIYINQNFTINQEFKKQAIDNYQFEIDNINFQKNEKATKIINKWVENITENKITNLIDSKIINDQTRAILINALYFKAKWQIKFPLIFTNKINFYVNETKSLQVDAMNLDSEILNYHESTKLKAKLLELPFRDINASMILILPNDKDGLKNLEVNLEEVFLSYNLTHNFVIVSLPKFRIESKLDFKKILQNLGVIAAFDQNQADLSGIAGQKGDLIFDEIIQKTFINVNEDGVEAAAATMIPSIVSEMGIWGPPKLFIADHPFMFYIKVNGFILFAGRVTNEKNVEEANENILVAYFCEKVKTFKFTTLWSVYSMLKSTIQVNENVDSSGYKKLLKYLKRQNQQKKLKFC